MRSRGAHLATAAIAVIFASSCSLLSTPSLEAETLHTELGDLELKLETESARLEDDRASSARLLDQARLVTEAVALVGFDEFWVQIDPLSLGDQIDMALEDTVDVPIAVSHETTLHVVAGPSDTCSLTRSDSQSADVRATADEQLTIPIILKSRGLCELTVEGSHGTQQSSSTSTFSIINSEANTTTSSVATTTTTVPPTAPRPATTTPPTTTAPPTTTTTQPPDTRTGVVTAYKISDVPGGHQNCGEGCIDFYFDMTFTVDMPVIETWMVFAGHRTHFNSYRTLTNVSRRTAFDFGYDHWRYQLRTDWKLRAPYDGSFCPYSGLGSPVQVEVHWRTERASGSQQFWSPTSPDPPLCGF